MRWLIYSQDARDRPWDRPLLETFVTQGIVPIVVTHPSLQDHIRWVGTFYDVDIITTVRPDAYATDPEKKSHALCVVRRGSAATAYAYLYSRFKGIDLVEYERISELERIEQQYVTAFAYGYSGAELLELLSTLSAKRVGLVAAESLCDMGLLTAKILSRPRHQPLDSVYLQYIDDSLPTRDYGSLSVVGRDANLSEAMEGLYKHAVIAAHGNGSEIYLGDKRLAASTPPNAYSAERLTAYHVFLDSCFGLRVGDLPDHPKPPAIWSAIAMSVAKSMVVYPGVKDNTTIECSWYLGLIDHLGCDLGTAVQLINRNLEVYGQDLGQYVLIGDPEYAPTPIEAPRRVYDIAAIPKTVSVTSSGHSVGFRIRGHDNTLITSPAVKDGFLVDVGDVMWLFRLSGESVAGTYRVEPGIDLRDFSPETFMDFEALRVIPRAAKGYVKEWESTAAGLASVYPQARTSVKHAIKAKRLAEHLSELRRQINILIRDALLRQATEGMFPFTELYSSTFMFKGQDYYGMCSCGGRISKKLQSHCLIPTVERAVLICSGCGIVADSPSRRAHLTLTSNFTTSTKGRLELCVGLPPVPRQSSFYWGVTYFGNRAGPLTFETGATSERTDVRVSLPIEASEGFSAVKAVAVCGEDLWYGAHPLYIREVAL